MSAVVIDKIRKEEMSAGYFWSNFLMNDDEASLFYCVKKNNKILMEARCFVRTEACFFVEVNQFSLTHRKKTYLEFLKFLKKCFPDLLQVIICTVSEDKYLDKLLMSLRFKIVLRQREIIKIMNRNVDLCFWSYEFCTDYE